VSLRLASTRVARGGRASLTVAVTADGRPATGTVTVRDGATGKAWRATLRSGRATIVSPALTKPGAHRFTVTYGGSAAARAWSGHVRVRVVK